MGVEPDGIAGTGLADRVVQTGDRDSHEVARRELAGRIRPDVIAQDEVAVGGDGDPGGGIEADEVGGAGREAADRVAGSGNRDADSVAELVRNGPIGPDVVRDD